MPNPSIQNRKKWPNLARICERYQLSDRAVANSVLVDVGLVTEDDKTRIIDRSKLRRERERCRNEIRSEEQQNLGLVNAMYLDGRKDATQIVAQGPNEKHYRSVQLEEHYTLLTFLLKMAKVEQLPKSCLILSVVRNWKASLQ